MSQEFEYIQKFLQSQGPVLALDIGSGTQDVILALANEKQENWPRFVLPAPAKTIAARILALTAEDKALWLHGGNMGGGFFKAVKAHLAKGLALAATPQAALSLFDNLDRVRELGIHISPLCPYAHTPVLLADYQPAFWEGLLKSLSLPLPSMVVAAAQDHGVHQGVGNREGRFQLWRDMLTISQGDPFKWVYQTPPELCTRLQALVSSCGGSVADTGSAAVLGALSMPEVFQRSQRQGVLILNLGNSHTIAFLLFQGQIWGVYEHHTGMLTKDSLLEDLEEFRRGWLPDEMVRTKGGHGCVFRHACGNQNLPPEAEGFEPTFILGPQRSLLAGYGQHIAPHGDMMCAGCHGLIFGLAMAYAQKQTLG